MVFSDATLAEVALARPASEDQLLEVVSRFDIVEFPDSKPMEKFESKTLKRTFDKIIFAETIRVVK